MFFGKDVFGNLFIVDFVSFLYLLIVGCIGIGKSVCFNVIILLILMICWLDEVCMLMIDLKMVEFSGYVCLLYLMYLVVIDMKKVEVILVWVVEKMEECYVFFV